MKSEWPSKIVWGTGSGPKKIEVEGVALENAGYAGSDKLIFLAERLYLNMFV